MNYEKVTSTKRKISTFTIVGGSTGVENTEGYRKGLSGVFDSILNINTYT